jgi:uncharacterized protein
MFNEGDSIRSVALVARIVTAWAKAQPMIRAVALVGSHARGTAGPDSDIDFMLLATDPDTFRADLMWVDQIDWHRIDAHPQKWQDEDYGLAWSRRVWLARAFMPVELTFAPLSWANADPPDAGTQRVISGGCRILYDPDSLLAQLIVSTPTVTKN